MRYVIYFMLVLEKLNTVQLRQEKVFGPELFGSVAMQEARS